MMAYDDMELDKLGERKTAMFIIISDTDDTFNFVVAMLYSQMFNLLCDVADDKYNGRLPIHVRAVSYTHLDVYKRQARKVSYCHKINREFSRKSNR